MSVPGAAKKFKEGRIAGVRRERFEWKWGIHRGQHGPRRKREACTNKPANP